MDILESLPVNKVLIGIILFILLFNALIICIAIRSAMEDEENDGKEADKQD